MTESVYPRISFWRRALYRVSAFVTWLFCKALFWVTHHGLDKAPEGPVLLVANHASYLDPILLGPCFPRRVHFMAKLGLKKVPILSQWMWAVGTIFVDSEVNTRQAISSGVSVLERGEVLAVFPEGSRTENGQILPFQRGILLLLKKSGATVVPAGIRGSFHAFPPGRILPRPCRCAVHFGAPMTAEEVLAEGGLEILRQRVSELSGFPLASTDAPEPQG